MGTEIHKAILNGRTRYALFGTVTMSYRTPFLPRPKAIAELEKRGFTKEAIERGFKQVTRVTAKKVGRAVEISFPVYRLTPLGAKPKKKKRNPCPKRRRR